MADVPSADEKWWQWCPKLSCEYLIFHWKAIFSVLWPIFSLVVFASGTNTQMRCMYALFIMVGYWVTECIPIYMTAMFLLFLGPLLKICTAATICAIYISQDAMTLAAVLIFSIVFEHHGIHIRLALGSMLVFGCHPRKLNFALSMITMFLSMWMMNVFVVALMCPIIMIILAELEINGVMLVYEPPDPAEGPDAPLRPSKFTLAYYFTMLFSATIGTIGTATGTSTFLAFKEDFHKKFPGGERIDYFRWMLLFIPAMIIIGLLSWASLQLTCMGLFQKTSKEYELCEKAAERKDVVWDAILFKYRELGRVTFAEYVIGVLFLFVLVVWLTVCPKTFEGFWKYGPRYIENSCFPYAVLFLMFMIPATWSCVKYCNLDYTLRPYAPSPAILTWDSIESMFPLGVLLLFSSGNAISKVIESTDTYEILRYPIDGLRNFVPFFVGAFASFISSVMTEVLPNDCVHRIVLKPLMELAVTMQVHPLRFAFPGTLGCSFGFLLPTSAPTYAIALAYSKIPTIELVKHGMLTKLIAWLVIILLLNTYGHIFYDFINFPAYATTTTTTNATLAPTVTTQAVAKG